MKGLFILIIASFSLVISTQGQVKELTHEPNAFIEELGALVMASDKKASKSFEDQWFSQMQAITFTDDQWFKIYDLTDYMVNRRIAADPFFIQWAELLLLYVTDSKTQDAFADILSSLEKTQKKSKDFQKYLSNLNGLFLKGQVFSTSSIEWTIDNRNFKLVLNGETTIEFKDVNLRCYAKGDSSIIYNTSGTYYPFKGQWFGQDGIVDWQRAGLVREDAYAEVNRYKIALKSPSFRMDSIRFHHYLFGKAVLGRLDEKILANVTPEKADYPRFSSYDDYFEIPNIVESVDFSGGFTMEGANFNGFGTNENPARLYFKYEDRTKVEVISDFINITETTLGATNAKVIIYLAGDSIVHPSLSAKFVKTSRLLTLFKTDKGLEKAPFHDTYHNFDIYVESYKWQIDDPIIDLGPIFGSSARSSTLSSVDYYSKDRYSKLMGLSRTHPLTALKLLSKKLGSNTFTTMDFAEQLQLSLTQAEVLLINLNIDGFVSYDVPSKVATILPKTDQYILSNQGKIDYDVIEFSSAVEQGNNGKLDLENNELTLRGVRFFTLSDSNNVVIFPSDGTIVLKKDRDIKFGGVVYAGKFEFFGSEYYFDYEKFTINLIDVDSARIKVPSFEPAYDGSRPLVYLKNVIEGIRGSIFIDEPNNKSGLKSEDFPEYPIFDCVKESFVYYDNGRIFDGVYKRDDFFYEIDPFKIDSLEKFNTENIHFEGRFVSAGIFEDMEEPLVIMPDYSLGFNLTLPEGGVGIYDDIAQFDNDISLSSEGLKGNGDLTYFTSTSSSEGFIFFPDSVTGITTQFVNIERLSGPEIPEAHAGVVDLHFYPFRNMLTAGVYNEPISMYNGQANLREGYLALTTNNMGGDGTIEFSGAFLSSDDFLYRQNDFEADTSSFSLASLTDAGMAFKTENVSSHVDFEKRLGEFEANNEESFVEFPENQYICYMDKFNWFMDNNDIELETSRGEKDDASDFVIDTDMEHSASNFFSIREDQDSLNFLAPKAIFHVNTSLVNCTDVNYIKVADAQVYPDSGNVTILKGGKLEEMLNAAIVANDVTKFHNIYNADVQINSRFDYKGVGFVDYVDETDETYQILLTKIKVDTMTQTVAEGKIVSEDNFMLSPYFAFQGDVFLEANREFLVFDGSTRILHDCEEIQINWFPFRAEVNPNQIRIPVTSQMASITGRKLLSGIVSSTDPFGLYPAFLSARKEMKDISLAEATGYITFDPSESEYQISTEEKLLQKSLPGQLVALNVNSCKVRTDGSFNIGSKFEPLDFKTFGSVLFDPVKNTFDFNAAMIVNFYFNEDGIKYFLTDVNRSMLAKGVDLNKTYYEKSIKEVMGQDAADKLITDLNLTGSFRKFPEELIKTLYLAGVNLEWDDAAEAYKSVGRIGIANIEDKSVFKSVEGKVMITKKRSGDRLEIYFQLDERKWYYFNYSRGIMEAYSSNKEFNNSITETKDDKRVLKGSKETGDYEYIIASRRKKDEFLERFED